MSIQGDQVVYDYLSRVGDLAQGKVLPARRATLVADLRARIEKEREKVGAGEPDAVRVLLGRLGEPEAIVAAELRRSAASPGAPTAGGPPASSGVSRAAGGNRFTAAAPSAGPAGGSTVSDATEEIPVVRPPGSGVGYPAGTGGFDYPGGSAGNSAGTTGGTTGGTAAGNSAATTGGNGSAGAGAADDGTPARWQYGDPVPPRPDAPSRVMVSVSPSESDAIPDVGEAISPIGQFTAAFGRSHWQELAAILILAAAAVTHPVLVVLVGYAVALTSRAWPHSDKRFAVIGVPLTTIGVLAVSLWLSATGKVGHRLTHGQLISHVHTYLATLPRAVGPLAALFLAWRLSRLARTPRPQDGPLAR